MRILVTDSGTRSGLAAVRSLGRAGHEVIVAGVRHPSLAGASRYAAALETYPDPARDAAGFLTALEEICTRRAIEVVLPMTEVTTLLVTGAQHRLPCRVPFPSADVVARASDKAAVVALAADLGVPVPRTRVIHAAGEAQALLTELPWPVVIKPARSRVRRGDGWLSTGVSYAHDAADLTSRLAALAPEVFPVLLQERIQGAGVGVFACFDEGRPVALFAHKRLREKPPSGGVSVLCESAPLDPVLAGHTEKLLGALGWRGVAMVEFKRDDRDGSARLMEINGRFWGSLQLSIDSGIDFPVLAVALATGTRPATPAPYRLGVRSRWLAGDLDSLLLRLGRSRHELDLPPGAPGRWRGLWDFLHFGGAHLRYEIERSDDWGPARFEWGRKLRGGG